MTCNQIHLCKWMYYYAIFYLLAEGHYLILASHHYKKQRSFQLSTNFQKNACLRFWYIMTGHSKFEVNLNEKPLVSPTSVYLSRNWLMYSVNVTLSGNESKLVFNGVMADQEGCAAIDDISLTTGYCRGILCIRVFYKIVIKIS